MYNILTPAPFIQSLNDGSGRPFRGTGSRDQNKPHAAPNTRALTARDGEALFNLRNRCCSDELACLSHEPRWNSKEIPGNMVYSRTYSRLFYCFWLGRICVLYFDMNLHRHVSSCWRMVDVFVCYTFHKDTLPLTMTHIYVSKNRNTNTNVSIT